MMDIKSIIICVTVFNWSIVAGESNGYEDSFLSGEVTCWIHYVVCGGGDWLRRLQQLILHLFWNSVWCGIHCPYTWIWIPCSARPQKHRHNRIWLQRSLLLIVRDKRSKWCNFIDCFFGDTSVSILVFFLRMSPMAWMQLIQRLWDGRKRIYQIYFKI